MESRQEEGRAFTHYHQQGEELGPACAPCRRAHAACDRQSPCSRCTAMGTSTRCRVEPPRKRGRPITKQLVHSVTPDVVHDMSPFLNSFTLAPSSTRTRQRTSTSRPPPPPPPASRSKQPRLASSPSSATTTQQSPPSSCSTSSPSSSSLTSPTSSPSSWLPAPQPDRLALGPTPPSHRSPSLLPRWPPSGLAPTQDDKFMSARPLPSIMPAPSSLTVSQSLSFLPRTPIAQSGLPAALGSAEAPLAPFKKRKRTAAHDHDHDLEHGGSTSTSTSPNSDIKAMQTTTTMTTSTRPSPIASYVDYGQPRPRPIDELFAERNRQRLHRGVDDVGRLWDDFWHGGGRPSSTRTTTIPRNPAPLALEHMLPFLEHYDFSTTPLVVTSLTQPFMALRIWEPRRIQDLRLPHVIYTSPSYAALSHYSTEEEVGRAAFSILPDLENMSLMVAHLLVRPEDASNVGAVFRCVCNIRQRGGTAVQVVCFVQNFFTGHGLAKWQIIVVESVLGTTMTLPPIMPMMKTDDLMHDYLQSRVAHYIHLLAAISPRSSVRAVIEQQAPAVTTSSSSASASEMYPSQLIWD